MGYIEKLKDKEQITEPDIRWSSFAKISSAGFIPIELNDKYEAAADIKLHPGVPEEIHSHFAAAQNLLVYSWFYYPFSVTAQLLAYITLEFALKLKFPKKKKKGLEILIKTAVSEGLIKNENFSHIKRLNEYRREIHETERQIMPDLPDFQEEATSYGNILVDTVPYLRNELAHGSPMLHNQGALTVRICAEFINQLYPEK